jgi:hypothetical protein
MINISQKEENMSTDQNLNAWNVTENEADHDGVSV